MDFIYFDCFSGASGDMIIAALLDCGASLEQLSRAVSSLSISAQIEVQPREVQNISSTSFRVTAEHAPLRHLADIEQIIAASSLPSAIQERSLQVFNRLAAAEAAVHGLRPEEVHFHEIGAADTIVDIIGTLVCLDSLGVETAYVSPFPWSGGLVSISHGRYPLPAPATSLLLVGFPCFSADAGVELVTPTGAALLTSLASPLPAGMPFTPERIGYGAGRHTRPDGVPNLLRVIQARSAAAPLSSETVTLLETEVDDLNPEIFSHLHQLFVSHPAVYDYFTSAVSMKKNRPGTLITLVTRPEEAPQLASLLMQESGSLGVRYRQQARYTIPRSEGIVETPWGPVRYKLANLPGGKTRIKPEYEDCQAIARQHNLPLLDIYSAVNALIAKL